MALVVAFLGGSSRFDMVQLMALRPLSALFLIPALYWATRENMRAFTTPLILLGLFALWMGIQLIPLPPEMWHSLPGREAEVALGRAFGMEELWRPISLVPSRGLNALASLIIPATALLLVAGTQVSHRTLLLILIGIGGLNAILGLFQVMGSADSPLYFYAITTNGAPVGLFANVNHAATWGAISMVMCVYALTLPGLNRGNARIALAVLFLLMLFAILVGTSRAGIVSAFLALIASGVIFAISGKKSRRSNHQHGNVIGQFFSRPAVILILAVIMIAALIFLFIESDKVKAFDKFATSSAFDDLRWRLVPYLQAMAMKHGFLGIGFGAFEEVYHIYEPSALMFPAYVNNAHNDLLQLFIEGGIPAYIIALCFVMWLATSVWNDWGDSDKGIQSIVFWVAIFAIILFSSLFDYPLRTPLFQALLAWIIALKCLPNSMHIRTAND